jgi:WhiB family transcriptional regulator, redox-sensing transcriptional regulator
MRTLSPESSVPTSALTTAPGADWRQASRCAGEPPDDFFPIGHGEVAQRQAERAKDICARCPVQQECLSWALSSDIREGVFGGLDEDERRALAARRRARRG